MELDHKFGLQIPNFRTKNKINIVPLRRRRRRKQEGKAKLKHQERKIENQLKGCIGVGLKLRERHEKISSCIISSYPLRCRYSHQSSPGLSSKDGVKDGVVTITTKAEDWISDQIYKKYTETDSRPLSPDIVQYRINRKKFHPRTTRILHTQRKCVTPEPPETKQCYFHKRRELVLDLRRVKSVDIMTRQNSFGSAGSGSGFGGDDDTFDGMLRLSSRSFSASRSRSVTPKIKTTPKHGVYNKKPQSIPHESQETTLDANTIPPLHSSVLALLGQKSAKASPRTGPSTTATGMPQDNFIANRQKKLRRHGRRRKSETQEKDEESTKVDPIPNSENSKDVEGEPPNGSQESLPDGVNFQSPIKPCTQLYQVLDDSLSKKRWFITDDKLELEVMELEKSLGKSEFKLRQMNIQEDLYEMSNVPPNTSKKRLNLLSQLKEKELNEEKII